MCIWLGCLSDKCGRNFHRSPYGSLDTVTQQWPGHAPWSASIQVGNLCLWEHSAKYLVSSCDPGMFIGGSSGHSFGAVLTQKVLGQSNHKLMSSSQGMVGWVLKDWGGRAVGTRGIDWELTCQNLSRALKGSLPEPWRPGPFTVYFKGTETHSAGMKQRGT